jgi:AcrR family transcriptional regulator
MSRMNPEYRRTLFLDVAYDIAQKKGYDKITRDRVAEQANTSVGLVNRVFKTMDRLRRAVMVRAVLERSLPIIAAGLCSGNYAAHAAETELKKEAMDWFLKAEAQ